MARFGELSLISLATASAFAESTSQTTTFAPSLANSRAHSAPMPCPDPVMLQYVSVVNAKVSICSHIAV